MAEQNVLAGDIAVMQQIISDVAEHNNKKERLDRLNDAKRNLSRELESAEREVKDETEAKIKAAVASICEGYDKAIAADRMKVKEIQTEREKAKLAGVKERIARETQGLHKENAEFKVQIADAFKADRIPAFCNSRIYFAFFQTKEFLDYLIYIASLLIVYLLIPGALSFVPKLPVWVLIIYYFVFASVQISVMKIIYGRTLVKHADVINDARTVKKKIAGNKKKINRIAKGIRGDKNEDMYGLESFDEKLEELSGHIASVEEDKSAALAEFEKTAKADIIAEINERYRKRIDTTKDELKKKEEEIVALDSLVKEQRIYISSNYEPYLGKEFMNQDKLAELYSYMKSGIADTVSQALAAYKDRH